MYICINFKLFTGKKRKKSKVAVPEESPQPCTPDGDIDDSVLSEYHIKVVITTMYMYMIVHNSESIW